MLKSVEKHWEWWISEVRNEMVYDSMYIHYIWSMFWGGLAYRD